MASTREVQGCQVALIMIEKPSKKENSKNQPCDLLRSELMDEILVTVDDCSFRFDAKRFTFQCFGFC